MQYLMKLKTEKPLFNYIVRFNDSFDYYLFEHFDDALKLAMKLGRDGSRIALIYEIYFENATREFKGQNTFTVFYGEVHYDKHARIDLHIQFYVNAGQWLNPNEEWIQLLEERSKNETNK